MERNIVLISLLDISKALVNVVSEFQIVCFSLSESSRFFHCFPVHPFPPSHLSCYSVSPIVLHALLQPCLVFIKALRFFIHSRLCVLILCSSWVFFIPSFFSAAGFLDFFFRSGSSPLLLTFGSPYDGLQHIHFLQHLFPFLISPNSSFFFPVPSS